MTQNERVLRALKRGPICQTDFDPPTFDGGLPIRRLAARIEELRRAGHAIKSEAMPNRLARYTLHLAVDVDADGQSYMVVEVAA